MKANLDPSLMPERIAARPRDPRGYPYLYMLGEEQFISITPERLVNCIQRRLCGICGCRLDYWIAFVGGPRSIENRTFTDPPFHRECVDYAASVCPYLLLGSYDRSKLRRAQEAQLADPTGYLGRVDQMGVYVTRDYRIEQLQSGVLIFHPAPAKSITWIDTDHK